MLFYLLFQILFVVSTKSAIEEKSLYHDVSYDNIEIMIKHLRNNFNKSYYTFAHYYSEIKSAKELFDIDPSNNVLIISIYLFH